MDSTKCGEIVTAVNKLGIYGEGRINILNRGAGVIEIKDVSGFTHLDPELVRKDLSRWKHEMHEKVLGLNVDILRAESAMLLLEELAKEQTKEKKSD